jgi:hypothetical protein
MWYHAVVSTPGWESWAKSEGTLDNEKSVLCQNLEISPGFEARDSPDAKLLAMAKPTTAPTTRRAMPSSICSVRFFKALNHMGLAFPK